jgi:hypothetical protein
VIHPGGASASLMDALCMAHFLFTYFSQAYLYNMIIFSYLYDDFSYAVKIALTGWFFLGLILMT